MAFPLNPVDGQIYGDYYYDSATDSWQQNQSRVGYNNEEIFELDYPGDEPIQGNAELFDLSTQDFISSENTKPTLYKSAVMEPVELTDWALNPHCWHLFPKENLMDKAPKDGLVVYYSMKNISGTTVIDDSGNGYDGTLAVTPTTLVGPPDGIVLDLNGTSQYLELPDEVKPSGRNFTISFLYKADDWTGVSFRQLIGGYGLSNSLTQGGIALTRYLDRLILDIYDGSARTSCNMPRVNFRVGSWHHIAITVANDGEIYVYVNGGIVGHNHSPSEIAPTTINWGSNKFRFGYEGGNTGNRHYADGQISEIRVYDRALSKAEIRAFSSRRVATAGFWRERENLLEDPDRMGSTFWSKARCVVNDLPTGNWRGLLESQVTANNNSGVNYVRQNTLSISSTKGAASVIYKLKTPSASMGTFLLRESDDNATIRLEVDASLDTPFTRVNDASIGAGAGDVEDFIWLEPDIFSVSSVGSAPTTTTYKNYISTSTTSNTIVNSILTSQVVNEGFVPPFIGDFKRGDGLQYPIQVPDSGTAIVIMRVPYIYNTYPVFAKIISFNEDTMSGASWFSNNNFGIDFYQNSSSQTSLRVDTRDSSGVQNAVLYNLTGTDYFQNRYQWHQVALTWENFNSGSANAEVKLYINDSANLISLSSLNISMAANKLNIGRNGVQVGESPSDVTESIDGWIPQVLVDDKVWTQQEIQDAYEMWYAYGHKWFATNRVIGKNYLFKKDAFGNKWPPE